MDFDFDSPFSDYYDEFHVYEENRERGSYIANHLAAPITIDDCEFLINHEEFYCQRHIKLKEFMTRKTINSDIYKKCNDPYNCIFTFINNEEINKRDVYKCYKKLWRTSKVGYKAQVGNFLENCLSGLQENKFNHTTDELYDLLANDTDLYNDFLVMKKVELIKEKLCLTKIAFGETIKIRNLHAERDIFFFNCENHGFCIGPTNLLLCILDIYQSRFSLQLYWKLSDSKKKYKYSMSKLGNSLIECFEDLRRILGNQVYKILSIWESMIIGFTINDNKNDLGFDKLFEVTRSEIGKILREYNVTFPSILIPQSRDKDLIKLYIEMTGIVKHFGHPSLDVMDGFSTVREHGTEKVGIDFNVVKCATGIFTRDFIKEYYHKKRKWPPLKECPNELINMYKNNIYPGRKHENDYAIWTKVKFDKIFDYDYSPDTSELLKDSASAPDMDQWFIPYDPCAFQHLYGVKKPRIRTRLKPTRVIERFLIGEEYELEKKIYDINNNYFDPLDYTAVLCRKEQELKVSGRLFVKQTYLQRLVQTSMEHNLAKQVMKYIPEQTMTDGEIQQMRRLIDTARKQGESLEIFNLDLTKWNLKFRHALVYMFGTIIDNMFGMKQLYKTNHYWFLFSKVFHNSRLYPPNYDSNLNPLEGDYFYTGHLGGMEGMRQKLWTIITITLIKYAAELCNLAIDIMCQGDNQVVMIRYKPSQIQNKKEIREKFLSVLSDVLGKVNLKLKLEETWFSIRLCEFGKIRYYDGEAISAGVKKIYRLIPDINDGVCSIMSSLSTINTITEALAKFDYTPDSAFIINQFHILNYLERKKIITIKDTDTQWSQFLFHPSEFGGITLSTYQSHFVRGNDDKLPIWLGIFMTLKRMMPEMYNKVISINQFQRKLGTPDMRKLIEDIFSLNIDNLPTIENLFKLLALDHLTSERVSNPEIRKLFEGSNTYSIENLVQILTSMRPMILSLAHEIVRNSNAGILNSLRTKFTNIQTINKITQEVNHRDFLDMMKINNRKLIRILKERKNYIESPYARQLFNKYTCPTHLARYLRFEHWNIEMIGETRSNPCHQFYIKPVDLCSSFEIKNSIMIQLSDTYSNSLFTNYLKDGPFVAYLGSATKEKVKKPSLDISTKTSYAKALQQLILIKSWMIRLGCLNLVKLIDSLIKEKIVVPTEDEEWEEEDWCAQNYGGHIIHRFRSIIERTTAITNFLPTSATHFKQSTNNLAGITAGGRDFTIHFQLVLLMNIARVMKIKEFSNIHTPQYASILACDKCTIEITDIKFDINPFIDLHLNSVNIEQEDLVQEYSYTFNELVSFLSIYLGRLFGKAADIIFNRANIDNKVGVSTISIPILSDISINDFRYIKIDLFLSGILQTSRNMRTIFKNLTHLDMIFSHGKLIEPLGLFLINSDMVVHFLSKLKINCYEHSHLTQPDKLSDIILLGFFNSFWSMPELYLKNMCVYWFMNDDIMNESIVMAWIIQCIKKNPAAIKNLNLEKIPQFQFKYSKKQLPFIKRKILKSLNSDTQLERTQTLPSESIISKFRNYPNKPLPDIYYGPIFPLLNEINIYLDTTTYKNKYHLFWEKVRQRDYQNIEVDLKDFFHVFRLKGNISTGICKIIEIFQVFKLTDYKIEYIYCLAEGSGSILEGLGCIYSDAILYYNTLLTPEIDIRPGPDYNKPPAILNSKKVSPRRIPQFNPLCMGTTNIMDKNFITKFKSTIPKRKFILLTIDAESATGGSNFDIITLYSKITLSLGIEIAIIKYFRREGGIFPPIDNPEYLSISFKPLLSNPCNQELYYIIFKKSILTKSQMNIILDLRNILYQNDWIGKGFPVQLGLIQEYLKLESIVGDIYKPYHMLSFPPDIFSSAESMICDVFCWKTILSVAISIHNINDFELLDYQTTIMIREGGLIVTLERLIKIYCILRIGINHFKTFKFIKLLSQFEIPKNIRNDKEQLKDGKLTSLYEIKTLIRRHSIRSECNCKDGLKNLITSISNTGNKILKKINPLLNVLLD